MLLFNLNYYMENENIEDFRCIVSAETVVVDVVNSVVVVFVHLLKKE